MTLILAVLAAAEPSGPCSGRGTAAIVDTRAHRLWLCERGAEVEQFKVAIGVNGTPKELQGDKKTPVGDYPIGEPRADDEYGWFVPIGYPTEEQRRRGMSGGDIGIHGPARKWKWLGSVLNWFDWTDGGIAVATDDEMERIADWVKSRRPGIVAIR